MIDPETLSQYSNKNDIDDEKLFEGDIIKYEGIIYEIIFQEEESRFIGLNHPRMINASLFCKSKKVGNRFDSPELNKKIIKRRLKDENSNNN